MVDELKSLMKAWNLSAFASHGKRCAPMRFITVVIASLLTFSAAFALPAEAQSLVGAWRQVEIEVMDGPNAGITDVENHGNLWVFSDQYHSLNVIQPNASRPSARDSWTTEQMAELFQSYVAFAGTYEVDGSTLTFDVDVSLSPGNSGTQTREITLTESTLETRSTLPDGARVARRYVRVD